MPGVSPNVSSEIALAAPAAALAAAARRPGWTTRAARGLVRRSLAGLGDGELTLCEAGQTTRYGRPASDGLTAAIDVHDPAFYRRLAAGGSIGAAESYMAGEWTADDLVAVVRLMARNAGTTGRLETVARALAQPVLRTWHALRRNSLAGARHNIAAHYDLGNDFFAAWLDPSLTYSCGLYERADSTLAEAQFAKIDRICRLLDLAPGERLLEIGCGWGALAIHAARHYGCQVTAVTLSPRQLELAERRVQQEGLSGRVTLVQQDYRRLTGRYDKLASVEMIEAVGHGYLADYFSTCSRLLAPHGRMALQAITIADRLYERYRRSVDFIQRYIFPGGHLPSLGAMLRAIADRTNLRLARLDDRPADYARTLADWRANFRRALPELRAAGRREDFLRMWEFYLAYCEGGFREQQIGLVQMVLVKPRAAMHRHDYQVTGKNDFE